MFVFAQQYCFDNEYWFLLGVIYLSLLISVIIGMLSIDELYERREEIESNIDVN